MTILVPEDIRSELLANGRERRRLCEELGFDAAFSEIDKFRPVLKLFIAQPRRVWLITEMDPELNDFLWGICDLGNGKADFGFFSIVTLAGARDTFGLVVERDPAFIATKSIGDYLRNAEKTGWIDA